MANSMVGGSCRSQCACVLRFDHCLDPTLGVARLPFEAGHLIHESCHEFLQVSHLRLERCDVLQPLILLAGHREQTAPPHEFPQVSHIPLERCDVLQTLILLPLDLLPEILKAGDVLHDCFTEILEAGDAPQTLILLPLDFLPKSLQAGDVLHDLLPKILQAGDVAHDFLPKVLQIGDVLHDLLPKLLQAGNIRIAGDTRIDG
mmetsp:Transcript_20206/g.27184  ORF Transcript_20206/g.27184 Transcript_20206/m.27184 type:complete len:203 (+) Transcript_20206:100-708(+)